MSSNLKHAVTFKDIQYLVLWVTDACNISCSYCYADAPNLGKQMAIEIAHQALTLPHGDFTLQLSGGEPLLALNLIEAIYSQVTLLRRTKKIKLQLQTNATLITPEIAQKLKAMDIAIGVSLDGPIAVNEISRGQTHAAIRGIQCLAAEGIGVNLNAVVTHNSVASLPELANLAAYLGNVRGIGLDLLRKTGRGSALALPSVTEIDLGLRALYAQTQVLEQLTGRRIIVREVEEARQRLMLQDKGCGHYCYASKGSALVVLPDGKLLPCGSLADKPQYHMGFLQAPETWRVLALNAKKDDQCSVCRYGTYCAGACPARSLVNEKLQMQRFTKEDCQLRKTAFQIAEGEYQ